MSDPAKSTIPPAPAYSSLPTAKRRAVRGGPDVREISVHLEVVTPILGGGVQTRKLDEIDVIRVPSVRGHLRFWWRALYGSEDETSKLYKRESLLWGRAATDDGGRSAVEIRINVEKHGTVDCSDIHLYDSRNGKATPGAYALWPARGETRKNTSPAPRRAPGTRFHLTLITAVDFEAEAQVRNALRAWILFGGYGGRTRRGLGSLSVLNDRASWLPSAVTREVLKNLFGCDLFAPTTTPGDVPWFSGAAIQVGKTGLDAQTAWTTALEWLREFRQGTGGQQGDRARESGAGKVQPQRPSFSNWPEADKLRHLASKTRSHPPRHNSTLGWPRAGFGLPIIGQFQTTDRNGNKYAYDEPHEFELRWRSPKKDRPREFNEHDRLASPLIVKALPLANGAFVPCALWLNRAYPTGGQVGLARRRDGEGPKVDPATAVSFDSSLVAEGDTALFSALANKTNLRQAFLDWLQAKYKTTVVAP